VHPLSAARGAGASAGDARAHGTGAAVLAVLVAISALGAAATLGACGGTDKREPAGGKTGTKPGTGQAQTPPPGVAEVQHGLATWYGRGAGTASGERFNPRALTAAHRTFAMQSRVRVTNQRNGRSVIVRINDRGPFVRGRIIDVSEAAAEILGMKQDGVVPVKVERLR
jgi:rare lipoprotein A (peptidoglycan hydrolase)